jgi:hypothetical protein
MKIRLSPHFSNTPLIRQLENDFLDVVTLGSATRGTDKLIDAQNKLALER